MATLNRFALQRNPTFCSGAPAICALRKDSGLVRTVEINMIFSSWPCNQSQDSHLWVFVTTEYLIESYPLPRGIKLLFKDRKPHMCRTAKVITTGIWHQWHHSIYSCSLQVELIRQLTQTTPSLILIHSCMLPRRSFVTMMDYLDDGFSCFEKLSGRVFDEM